MSFIKKFRKSISKDKRIFKIDKVHGVNVIEKFIDPIINLYDGKGIKIFSLGREQDRLLEKFNIDYSRPEEYFNQVKKDNGWDYELIDRKETYDLIIFWGSNFIEPRFIHQLRNKLCASVLTIGDSYLVDYFTPGEVIRFMYNSDIYCDTIDGIPGFSQELIYLTNRIRTGEIQNFKETNNRTYEFTDEEIEIEELMDYDVTVVPNSSVVELNKYIRELIFKRNDTLPDVGDRMITYEPIQTKDIDGNRLDLRFGEEVKVLDTRMETNGIFVCKFKTNKGVEFEHWVDTNWLGKKYNDLDMDHVDGGRKFFYSYVVPPEVIVDNTYNSMACIVENNQVNEKRVLYSVLTSVRKELKVYYNGEKDYLF